MSELVQTFFTQDEIAMIRALATSWRDESGEMPPPDSDLLLLEAILTKTEGMAPERDLTDERAVEAMRQLNEMADRLGLLKVMIP